MSVWVKLERHLLRLISFGMECVKRSYLVGNRLLKRYYPNHTLYLAVSEDTRKTVFEEEAGQTLIEDGIICLVTFDPTTEVIVQWIH